MTYFLNWVVCPVEFHGWDIPVSIGIWIESLDRVRFDFSWQDPVAGGAVFFHPRRVSGCLFWGCSSWCCSAKKFINVRAWENGLLLNSIFPSSLIR